MQGATGGTMPGDADAAPRHGFLRRPEARATGDARRGRLILGGHLRLLDGTLTGDPFAQAPASEEDARLLHGFGWIDDLAAVGTALARGHAQSRVLTWVRRNPDVPPDPAVAGPEWRADVTGRRALRWVFHAGTLLPGLDRPASSPVFASLHEQLSYLARHAATAPEGLPRIEALSGLAIAAMSLRGAEGHAVPALLALAVAAEASLSGGALPDRNPEALLDAAALLVWTGEVAAEAQRPLPAGITRALEAVLPVLRALRHADGGLPRAHGGGVGAPGRLDHVLGDGTAAVASLAMGFARMARAGSTLILDAAPPPPGARACAATLGLEFTHERTPLLVACGSGAGFPHPWPLAARATACASTLVLDGLSSARLGPARAGQGAPLVDAPRNVRAGGRDAEGRVTPPDCGPPDSAGVAHLLAGHDGWRESHGLTHMRELWLEVDGLSLRGEDSLAAVDAAGRNRFSEIGGHEHLPVTLHFHLHPAVAAQLADGAVTLAPEDGPAWTFRQDGAAAMTLAPSVWFDPGAVAPVASRQIVLTAPMGGFARRIGWRLTRKG